MCVNYVGDCEGTIYPGEVKTCTVENYIFAGEISTLYQLMTILQVVHNHYHYRNNPTIK